MSDVSRYLPLSQRKREDESGVTGDWRAPFGVTLGSLADTLETLGPDGWDAPTTRPAISVRAVVGELAWRLTATRRDRAVARLGRHDTSAAERSDADVVAVLRSAAAADRRRRIGDLSDVMVAALDVRSALAAAGLPHTIVTEPRALGAVAVARALSAPLPIRAVIAGVTLVATDGDWRVGRGPEREAAASDIVLFLFGRLGVPGLPAGDYAGDE